MVIKGKISAIINSYTVALNIGENKGVSEGMKFNILYPEIVIPDPETKQELGRLNYVKARIKIIKVYDKFCVARSDEQVVKPIFPSFLIQSSETKKLPVDEYLIEVEEKIRIGDAVIQIKEKSEKSSE